MWLTGELTGSRSGDSGLVLTGGLFDTIRLSDVKSSSVFHAKLLPGDEIIAASALSGGARRGAVADLVIGRIGEMGEGDAAELIDGLCLADLGETASAGAVDVRLRTLPARARELAVELSNERVVVREGRGDSADTTGTLLLSLRLLLLARR